MQNIDISLWFSVKMKDTICHMSRRQVDEVVASLEDELALLDERYAQILKTAHQLQSAEHDSSSDSELEVRHALAEQCLDMDRSSQLLSSV